MYQSRREEFMRRIGSGSVGIFRSAPEAERRKYRQDSNFYYLTGFDEPDSACLIAPNHPEHKFVLFVRPKNWQTEQSSGLRIGVEGAIECYGADVAYPIEEFAERAPTYLDSAERIYYCFGSDPHYDEKILSLVKKYAGLIRLQFGVGPNSIVDAREILHEMRAIKSGVELKLLRRAAEISAEAHIAAMKAMRPGIYEYEIEAVIEYIFRKNGALMPAYGTIVGSGANGTILHYRTNETLIEDGVLVLIDAGAEYHYYSGDITRTIPANGKFSKEQQEVYEVVLASEMAAIETVKPGATFIEPLRRAREVMTGGLVRLGILEGEISQLIAERKYGKYMSDAFPHWLGMDNHDAGKYRLKDGTYPVLEPNIVKTVEPGLYLTADMTEIPEKYRNIGVRIEDDIVVTAGGYENLTAEVPKTVAEVEKMMKKKLIFTFP